MSDELAAAFPRLVDRALITHPAYSVVDWQIEQRFYTVVDVTLSYDGCQQLAEDAALGRRVERWRARNPELARILDAEAALDALAGVPT